MTKRILVLSLVGLVLAGYAHGQVKVGTAGAKFLSIGVIPRAMAMGEAYTAVGNDAAAVFWNPAGIAHLSGGEVFTSYTHWIADGRVPAVAYAFSKSPYGVLAVFSSGIYMGGFEGMAFDENNNIIETGEFSYSALQVGVSFARFYTDKFATGVNLKVVQENYGDVTSATTVALDAGTFFYTGFRSLRVAMSLQNLGADATPRGQYDLWISEGSRIITEPRDYRSYPLPLTFRLGAAMELFDSPEKGRLTVAAEAANPRDNEEVFSIGMEYVPLPLLTLRTGYAFNKDEGGFGFGVGLKTSKIHLDFSFSDMNHLPDIYRLSLTFGLGR